MNRNAIQRRIGSLFLVLLSVGALRATMALFDPGTSQAELAGFRLSLLIDLALIAVFGVLTFNTRQWARGLMAFTVFGSSSVVLLTNSSTSYFGLATIVGGALLFQRFGMLERRTKLKLGLILVWTLTLILVSDQVVYAVPLGTSLATFAFVVVNVLFYYFLFEEEIRDLLASNKSKDAALANQAAEIARLEPLSVLGQRVAHVAHSFKNNLNQISTTLFLLEQGNDPLRAAAKLREFSNTLNERIENILMVSRAGVDLKAETFDLARVLEGIKHVYLQEQGFLSKAKTTLNIEGSVLVHMVRWDFLLMAENILKNALEAITEKGVYGAIRIELSRGSLKFANNGSPMPLCKDCEADCLNCPRYGQPGRTTKKTGSGHGLAQVFATCRAMKWTLKISSDGEWTTFDIGLPAS